MRRPWEVIKLLEADNSRLAKESIIKQELAAKNTEFFEGVRTALDTLITFGLKQIDEKIDEDGPGLDWDSFSLIITGFVNRQLTGNLARDTVQRMMNSATKEQWNYWYRRILIKDLQCGVSEKTVNKVVKGHDEYIIPVFTCQLAHDSANYEGKISGKKYVEVKLDGVRVLTIVYPDGRVDQCSREGKELVNFEHIKNQFASVASYYNEPMVFDGEVMSASFQDLMKQVRRKEDVNTVDAVLHLFDIIPLADFEKGFCATRQEDRSKQVYSWHKINKDSLPNIQVVGHELVDLDTIEGDARLEEINSIAIAGGYEGIMMKDPDAPYECKRSVSWLKMKPFIEVSLEVVGFEEGTKRNKGRLGAIVGSGVDDGKHIRVNVGSGFSDKLRTDIWNNREAITGDIMEVRADAITKSQDSDGTYSLRFPRFKCFRGFAHGEKL
jgi:DNA ligase-1